MSLSVTKNVSPSEGLSWWAILLIVIGCIIVGVGIAVGVFFLIKKQTAKHQTEAVDNLKKEELRK